jgi:hypothetical protein
MALREKNDVLLEAASRMRDLSKDLKGVIEHREYAKVFDLIKVLEGVCVVMDSDAQLLEQLVEFGHSPELLGIALEQNLQPLKLAASDRFKA